MGFPLQRWGQSASLEHDFSQCLKATLLRLAQAISKVYDPDRLRREVTQLIRSAPFTELSTELVWMDEVVDRLLGLNETILKRALVERTKTVPSLNLEDLYLSSDPEDLFTPYRVVRTILKELAPKPGYRLVDLGAGLGRVALTAKLLYPRIEVLGVEILAERLAQAQQAQKQLGISSGVDWVCGNVHQLKLPPGDCYFLFNPFSNRTLVSLYGQFLQAAKHRPFRIVVIKVGRAYSFFSRRRSFSIEHSSRAFKNWDGIGYQIYRAG